MRTSYPDLADTASAEFSGVYTLPAARRANAADDDGAAFCYATVHSGGLLWLLLVVVVSQWFLVMASALR